MTAKKQTSSMNKNEFATRELMEKFVEPMLDEGGWVMDVHQYVENGPFTVFWFEHKKYTDETGKKVLDEIWRTEDLTVHLVQDMGVAELRKALRYILRSERQAVTAFEAAADEDEPFSPYVLPGSTTLQ